MTPNDIILIQQSAKWDIDKVIKNIFSFRNPNTSKTGFVMSKSFIFYHL